LRRTLRRRHALDLIERQVHGRRVRRNDRRAGGHDVLVHAQLVGQIDREPGRVDRNGDAYRPAQQVRQALHRQFCALDVQ